MNLILQGRGVTLDDRLRSYADEKFSKLQRFFDHIDQMEVELRRERNPRVADGHRVDVVVKTNRDILRAHGEGADHFVAIDRAAHRLEVQIKRIKDRITDHHHHHHHRTPRDNGALPEPPSTDIVEMPGRVTKPMVREEAKLELESMGLEFLLFTDADTMRAAVIYRRPDGAYGLIAHDG